MARVSPGTYVREFDFSQYVSQVSNTICGCIVTATKGPVNKPTRINSEPELMRIFGIAPEDDYGLLCAGHYLQNGTSLVVTRVANGATEAEYTFETDEVTPQPVFTVKAASPGSAGNKIRVILESAGFENRYNFIVFDDVDGRGNIAEVERFEGASLDYQDDYYIERLVNVGVSGVHGKSRYIEIEMIDGALVPLTSDTQRPLVGGDDGLAVGDADIIGTYSGQTATGLKTFANPETVDLNLLIVPGRTSPSVQNAMVSLCEDRTDCMTILDTPFGLSVNDVVDWHNGAGAFSHSAINSSYAALYWSWCKTFDPYRRNYVWVPPSGIIAGQYAYNDRVAYPWFAPAGYTRGLINNVVELEVSPDQGQRDFLQGGRNCINPLVEIVGQGISIKGQKTMQRQRSSTDRVNVRRMLLHAKKLVAGSVRYLEFEPNDQTSWNRFVRLVAPHMRYIKERRGMYKFDVSCDESTNPPENIDDYILNGRIYVQPTKAAEKIFADFILTQTGADFTEVAELV